MDFRHHLPGGSPSSSSTTSSSSQNPTHHHHNHNGTTAITTTTAAADDPMHSWWESISKARSRIHLLSTLLPVPESDDPNPISSLADSDAPARSLLSSPTAYTAVSYSLTAHSSGAGDDPLCNWLYDTFISSDPDLRLVVLAFIPLVAGVYMSRIHSISSLTPSLAGFEAVLLALYSSETRSRAGKPVIVSIPDLSQPSLYHTPRVNNSKKKPNSAKVNPNSGSQASRPAVGIVSPPLEPQTAIKSTKRATIVGVALDCYYKQISQMPSWSKVDFCKFAGDWAGQDCNCKSEFDHKPEVTVTVPDSSDGIFEDGIEIERNVVEDMKNLEIHDANPDNVVKGSRILLPWELLQPMLRILGHCLLGPLNSNDVKDAASSAVRCLYARASHDLVPQAILATRSLIQLDNRAREAAAAAAAASASAANTTGSNANTPSKAKKPEILLVSK
ncbi:hypothetical protein E3N88_35239 [Mikania micrantha]|uniref:Hyccin n=1 Tax=Mikania micrantha TaxID=192012 RepID=A0A5N6M0D9_9ASTR|nr:hypothetical protein E3N88_35239 [Mikania micrantha]